jgi:hypothetical protein
MSDYLGDLATAIVHRQRLAQLLHACGPRPFYELLAELEGDHPGLMLDFEAVAERYVTVPPFTYRALGAHDFNNGGDL